jgi:hypothetical protein
VLLLGLGCIEANTADVDAGIPLMKALDVVSCRAVITRETLKPLTVQLTHERWVERSCSGAVLRASLP